MMELLLMLVIFVGALELAAWRRPADSRDGDDWANHPSL